MTDVTVAYLTMKSQSSVSCLTLCICVYPGFAQVCPSSFWANQVHPNLEGCAKRWGANGCLRLRSPANWKKWPGGSWLVQARARGVWAERRGSYWTVRLQMNTSGQWKRSPLPVLPPYKTAGALWQLILEKYLQSLPSLVFKWNTTWAIQDDWRPLSGQRNTRTMQETKWY